MASYSGAFSNIPEPSKTLMSILPIWEYPYCLVQKTMLGGNGFYLNIQPFARSIYPYLV